MNSKKILIMIMTLIFASVFTFFSVNAVQDFSVNTSTISQTVNVSTSNNFTINIVNSGNESINLTVSKVDLVSGSNTIPLTLDSTSISNLANGTTHILTTSYTTGTVTGTYTGSIKVTNSNNLSQNKTISVSVTVQSTTVNGASVEFVDESSTLLFPIVVDDSSEKKTFVLKNNGNVKLNDVEIDLDSRFDGNNDNIDDNDFEINGENGDRTYSLKDDDNVDYLDVNDTYNVKLRLDIPSNLDVDDYRGDIKISYIPEGSTTRVTQTLQLKIVATSDNEDIYFDTNTLYVKSGILDVLTAPDETTTDLEFSVRNDASYDIQNITYQLNSDLKEENSGNILPKSAITFRSDSVDIYSRDSENVKFDLTIPKDQPVGTYTADINLYSSTGKKIDKISLRIKVMGDIYIDSINFNSNVKPGDYLDVPVVIKNKGSSTQRNIMIKGTLSDIDSSNSDIYESSSNFLLESNTNRTETLRFKIPKDASSGSHVLEINVVYDTNIISQIENVEIDRPIHKIDLSSYAINPSYVKCQDSIYTYVKFQNLGKYSEDISVTSQIENTDIKQSTNTVNMEVDEIMQKSLVLDVSSLNPGTYNVIQKVNYAGNAYEKRETSLVINSCNNATISGVDIKNINDTNMNDSLTNTTQTSKNVNLFGHEISKTTAYLGGGVGATFLLIVVALFLL